MLFGSARAFHENVNVFDAPGAVVTLMLNCVLVIVSTNICRELVEAAVAADQTSSIASLEDRARAGDVLSMRQLAERYGEGDPKGYKRDLLKLYPQGASARFIRPEEIAELVWFLCQPYAEAITGANLAMDFGLSAGK